MFCAFVGSKIKNKNSKLLINLRVHGSIFVEEIKGG